MRLRIWREFLLSQGRGGWALEGAGLLLAALWSKRRGARGPLGLAPAARGQGSQAGGTAREAQALVHVPSPPPPRQLRLQALDLLPQSVVVFLQRLVLLGGKQVGREGVSASTRGPPSPTSQGSQLSEKIPPACKCPSWGPLATLWPTLHNR